MEKDYNEEKKKLKEKYESKSKEAKMLILPLIISIAVIVASWNFDLTFFLVVGFFATLIFLLSLVGAKSEARTAKTELDTIEVNERAYEILKRRRENEDRALFGSPVKCPHCGSTNTKKISLTRKATSVYMVGMLSDKIGKEYECMNCKMKF